MLSWVKALMCLVVGVDAARVGLHSFRIGGATSLALLGVPAHVIMVFGRWESLCYQLYTRTSESHLRGYMALMAAATSPDTNVPLFGGLSLDRASEISEASLDALPRLVLSSSGGGRRQTR